MEGFAALCAYPLWYRSCTMTASPTSLLGLTERASRAIVWNSPIEKVAAAVGLYESLGDYSRPGGVTFHGLGVAKSSGGWHVEAYCECESKQRRAAQRAVALHIGAAPADVLIVPCTGFDAYAMTEQVEPPPLMLGAAVAHQALAARGGYGTFGGFASDLESELLLAVSNNHVFANENTAAVGDPLFRVSNGSCVPLGTLRRFVEILAAPMVNDVDAAVGTISRTNVVKRFRTNGVRSPAAGLRVKKLGARTGHTTGRIVAVAATATVNYSMGPVNFRRCLRIEGDDGPFSLPGDSGSLVLDANNAVVGLLFGGEKSGAYSLACWGTTVTQLLSIAF